MLYLIVAKGHLTKDEIKQQLKKITPQIDMSPHYINDALFLKFINEPPKSEGGLLSIDIDIELDTSSKYKFGIAEIRGDSKGFGLIVMNDKLQDGEN
jgi:hypothetical protein